MRMIKPIAAGLVLSLSIVMFVQAGESSAPEDATVANQHDDAPENNSASVVNGDAEQLYIGRCSSCHQLPDPAMLKMKQWKLVLATMQLRMQQASLPPLTAEETATIMQYLAAQTGK